MGIWSILVVLLHSLRMRNSRGVALDRIAIVTLLKRHRAELAARGVISLSLFGSMAREETTDESDVDLAVTLTPGKRGFEHLDRLDRLKEWLADILSRPVDLIEEPARSARIQHAIDQDRVIAF